MGKEMLTEPAADPVRRRPRSKYSAEEKIRIVLEGLRSEISISQLCQREGIPSNLYYRWNKEFIEAGKRRLKGETPGNTEPRAVVELRRENEQLKQLAAELMLKNRILKQSLTGSSFEEHDS